MTLIFARQVTKEIIEKIETYAAVYIICRAVGWSENPGGGRESGEHNLLRLVEIGLTDLYKSGGTITSPVLPVPTSLNYLCTTSD
jgi:hypothetical protein